MFWLLHLDDESRRPTPRFPDPLPAFSVQLLSPSGGATEQITHFGLDADHLSVGTVPVPDRVLQLARTLEPGQGLYLDCHGVPTDTAAS
ncbi:hypothetical protein BAC2_01770 [uncultured bacterium]|nr:hypothetical protein BAC2_01770 [uncultured bacterium]